MSDIKHLPRVAHYCINQGAWLQMCGPSSFVSNFNFCFLGVIPKLFPKEQLPKSSLAYLTLTLEAGNDIPASGHLHLVH